MRYEEPEPISQNEAERIFQSDSPEMISDALVRLALNDPDWRWVQSQCIRFARDQRQEVRATAALCLGHLARIHRAIDVALVRPLLNKLLEDPFTKGRAEDALDDIHIYVEEHGDQNGSI